MDHFIFEGGGGGRQLPKKIPAQLKVEKTNHAQWAKEKNRVSLFTRRIVRPNEKIICNFCHNLISTHKNAV